MANYQHGNDDVSNEIEPFELYADENENDTYEEYRQHMEYMRPIYRVKAQKALNDLYLESELAGKEDETSAEVDSACDYLEGAVSCLADEPLPSCSPDCLDFKDWHEYDYLRFKHGLTGNMVMLLRAFTILVHNGIAPGSWILEPLAAAFDDIIEERDPLLVASALGLQARGSGSTSPFSEFERLSEDVTLVTEMRVLIEWLGISQERAANAVKDKHQIQLAAKSLVKRYKQWHKHPELVQQALDKHSYLTDEEASNVSEESAQSIRNSYPPETRRRFLEKKLPPKT